VLGLVAAAAAVGIPLWFARPEVSLERAALLLAEDVRDAQDRAAFGHRELSFVFLPGGDGYEVRDVQGEVIEARLGPEPFRREYSKDAVFRGVTLRVVEGAAQGRLTFDRRGFLLDPARIELTFRGASCTLVLEDRTGSITVEGLDGRILEQDS
jgi:hypothetical protein